MGALAGALVVWTLWPGLTGAAGVLAPGEPVGAGASRCEVRCGDVPLLVYTYKPPSYGARPGPLILVFHGVGRNARAYRDSARPLGDRFSALIAVPEFEEERFPE